MILKKQIKELTAYLDRQYNADVLTKIYKRYIQDILPLDLTIDSPPKISFLNRGKTLAQPKKRQPRKPEVLDALVKIYTNRELFQQLLKNMPDIEAKIFQKVIWEEWVDIADLEEEFGVQLIVEVKPYPSAHYTIRQLKDEFLLFWTDHNNHLGLYHNRQPKNFFLPTEILTVLRKICDAPPDYQLKGVASLPQTDFIYEVKDGIFREICSALAFIEQGFVEYTKHGKPTKKSLRDMINGCRLREFYPDSDKDLGTLQAELLILFLETKNLPNIHDDPLIQVRKLFDLFRQETKINLASIMLSHLKGLGNIYLGENMLDLVSRENICHVLKSFPPHQWVSVDNAWRGCIGMGLSIVPIKEYDSGRYLYQDLVTRGRTYQDWYQNDRLYADRNNYRQLVVEPYFKGSLFLLGTLGVIDLAYDRPYHAKLHRLGKEYISVYDGLKYVRVSPLGAYLLGNTKNYEYQAVGDSAKILLDEDRLLITIYGENPLKSMLVNKLADQISDNRFLVSNASFLKECRTKTDIEAKIQMFRDHIESKPPHHWEDFFDRLLANIDPFKRCGDMIVFQLKKQDAGMIAMVVRDPILKKMVFKAEDYHLMIKKSNALKFRQRLEELGFLITV